MIRNNHRATCFARSQLTQPYSAIGMCHCLANDFFTGSFAGKQMRVGIEHSCIPYVEFDG